METHSSAQAGLPLVPLSVFIRGRYWPLSQCFGTVTDDREFVRFELSQAQTAGVRLEWLI